MVLSLLARILVTETRLLQGEIIMMRYAIWGYCLIPNFGHLGDMVVY